MTGISDISSADEQRLPKESAKPMIYLKRKESSITESYKEATSESSDNDRCRYKSSKKRKYKKRERKKRTKKQKTELANKSTPSPRESSASTTNVMAESEEGGMQPMAASQFRSFATSD